MGMTTGQLVGSIGGGIIGSFFGPAGFYIGMSLGGLIGGWLDPADAPDPPPTGDLGINSYVHNAPIPLAYGQNKLYGGCVWMGDIDTAMEESGGGKKSPSTYSAQMWVEFAMAHCEGEVQGYTRRYWIDDKTIWDIRDDDMYFTVVSYNGSATQTVNADIDDDLAGSANPAVPFKYTAYSVVNGYFDGGYFNTIPSFSAEVIGFLTEEGEEDANPIRCLYDFLTNTRYGVEIPTSMFDGDPDTPDTSWYIASAYCDELVEYIDQDGVTVQEPRFRYSNEFDSRVKGYDIVKDILQTCRGIIAFSQGLLFAKIENENENVSGYFSDEYTVDLTSGGGCTVNRIYFSSTIAEPSGFWEGAYLSFKIDDVTYSEMINIQETNYVDLVDDLPLAPDSGITVSLTKDNIKEGSFNWTKTPSSERINSCRIEFINRKAIVPPSTVLKNNYIWDVVEVDQPEAYTDVYIDHTRGEYNQKQIRLKGVKRKSQAMRMCKWFADFSSYVVYYCEFVTDVVGYLFKVGDIIGVSHSTLGWEAKEFRIVSMEEISNDEIKLNCLEYSRFIYGDDILQVFNTTSPSPGDDVYTYPDDIERVHVVQDIDNDFVWVNFKRPDSAWWMGAQVWLKRGVSGEYVNVGQFARATYSVELLGAIDDVQTTIPFSSATLYGTFPDAGSFWIEDELITYTSIDEVNNEFEGCTRGTNATAHASGEYCHLKQTTLPRINFYNSDVGVTWYIKIVSVNIAGIVSDFDDATEVSLTIV
jgi:hypothetical protein